MLPKDGKKTERGKMIFKSVATHVDSAVNLRGNRSQNKNMESLCCRPGTNIVCKSVYFNNNNNKKHLVRSFHGSGERIKNLDYMVC